MPCADELERPISHRQSVRGPPAPSNPLSGVYDKGPPRTVVLRIGRLDERSGQQRLD